MNWLLVIGLAATGFLYAGATIAAWISGFEGWVVLALIIGAGKMAAFFAPKAPMRNAFAGGFLMALAAVWTQGAFITTYFANNPEYATISIPFGLDARTWTFVSAPIGAVVAGALSAAAAFCVDRFIRFIRPKGGDRG